MNATTFERVESGAGLFHCLLTYPPYVTYCGLRQGGLSGYNAASGDVFDAYTSLQRCTDCVEIRYAELMAECISNGLPV